MVKLIFLPDKNRSQVYNETKMEVPEPPKKQGWLFGTQELLNFVFPAKFEVL